MHLPKIDRGPVQPLTFPVVANLEALPLDRLHEMQVFGAANPTEDDVSDLQGRWGNRFDGAELA